MTKKKKKCANNFCDKITHGILCKDCSYKSRKKFKDRKEYAANWHRQKKYGICPDEFYLMWIAFRGKCGICECDMIYPVSGRGQPMNSVCVDHDHSTGKVRGLLCSACNKAIGLFKDSVIILEKAKRYLS